MFNLYRQNDMTGYRTRAAVTGFGGGNEYTTFNCNETNAVNKDSESELLSREDL